MAQVKKSLPFGYGTATGHKFQILETSATSEDQEDYGRCQKDRVGMSDSKETFNF